MSNGLNPIKAVIHYGGSPEFRFKAFVEWSGLHESEKDIIRAQVINELLESSCIYDVENYEWSNNDGAEVCHVGYFLRYLE